MPSPAWRSRFSMNSSRTRGSRPLKGSSSTSSLGRNGRAQASAIFSRMPWDRSLILRSGGRRNCARISASSCPVPGRIEGAQIGDIFRHGHAPRHFLVFGDIADLRQFPGRDLARIHAQDRGAALRRRNDVHQRLDGGGFAGAIGADQGEGAAFGHRDAQSLKRIKAPIFLPHIVGLDDHASLPSDVLSSLLHCAPRASTTSRRLRPRRLASTTNCSNSW